MSDLQLIRNCAPTLAGIKIANLFSTKERETARIAYWLKRWNGELNDKGVFVRCQSAAKPRSFTFTGQRHCTRARCSLKRPGS